MRLPCLLIVASVVTSHTHGREWSDSTGKFSVEGELVWHDEKSIVLEKPDGSRVHIAIAEFSKKDAEFLSARKGEKAARGRPALRQRRNRNVEQNQQFTFFGEVKLDQKEIDLFLQQCREQKPKLIQELQRELNFLGESATPAEILESQKTLEFVSQDNVLIAPRLRVASYSAGSKLGAIFKPAGGSYSPRLPYAHAETLSAVDGRLALVKLEGNGPAILDGINVKDVPIGEWKSYFLFKSAGSREIPGVVGPRKVQVVQAVSSEGFPKDIVIW